MLWLLRATKSSYPSPGSAPPSCPEERRNSSGSALSPAPGNGALRPDGPGPDLLFVTGDRDPFPLPLSLVYRAFIRLEKEGLLAKIRGSRTVLPGKEFDRHLYIRGVIGIPVSIFRFSAFADYREFVLVLRRKLRRHQFMPAAVFYEQDQNRADFLSERLFDAKADHVLWFCRAALRERSCRSCATPEYA